MGHIALELDWNAHNFAACSSEIAADRGQGTGEASSAALIIALAVGITQATSPYKAYSATAT